MASLKRDVLADLVGHGVESSTAISRGLIEAAGRAVCPTRSTWSSTAISRGLIEATSAPSARPCAPRHPRRSAVASLKRENERRGPRDPYRSSTAISRGLIEAGRRRRVRPVRRGHPRRSAVASLKRCVACARRTQRGRHPRRSAVASLKHVNQQSPKVVKDCGHPRRSAVASLKPARVASAAGPDARVIHGDQPWPH